MMDTHIDLIWQQAVFRGTRPDGCASVVSSLPGRSGRGRCQATYQALEGGLHCGLEIGIPPGSVLVEAASHAERV